MKSKIGNSNVAGSGIGNFGGLTNVFQDKAVVYAVSPDIYVRIYIGSTFVTDDMIT